MKLRKYLLTALLAAGVVSVAALTACGTTTETDNGTQDDTTIVSESSSETSGEDSNENADTAETITQEEAINLVKADMSGDYSYIPADNLEEKDGNQYYVIYVKQLMDGGTMTTMATYMVNTDGSEVFDKYAVDYTGEYVRTGTVGDVTFVVSEDGTFEMTTTGAVTQVIGGNYKLGITDSASVVKLALHVNKNVVNGEEQEIDSAVEGTAVIEGNQLTLSLQSDETVFTKK